MAGVAVSPSRRPEQERSNSANVIFRTASPWFHLDTRLLGPGRLRLRRLALSYRGKFTIVCLVKCGESKAGPTSSRLRPRMRGHGCWARLHHRLALSLCGLDRAKSGGHRGETAGPISAASFGGWMGGADGFNPSNSVLRLSFPPKKLHPRGPLGERLMACSVA